MKTLPSGWARRALTLAAVAGSLALTTAAFADPPYNMAPPVDSSAQTTDGDTFLPDSVFKWTEIPQNQDVPIRRAVFDRGGYQLYDEAGETIIVPFSNDNLYVMKFGQSSNGKYYFRSEDGVPVLYIPRNGYLDNAAVPNARWYPFSRDFHPEHPVFVGIAPSWNEYIHMGWYPEMHCYGGYWGDRAFFEGAVFAPTFGLFFEIGGHPYYGWERYHDYYERYPAPYHVSYWHRDYYRAAEVRHEGEERHFGGTGWNHRPDGPIGGRSYEGRTFSTETRDNSRSQGRVSRNEGQVNDNVRTFRGGGRDYSVRRTGDTPVYNGRSGNNDRSGTNERQPTETGGGRTFRGGDRSYGNDRASSGGMVFSSGRPTFSGGGRSSESGPVYSGGERSSGSRPSYSSGRGSFGSGRSSDSGQSRSNSRPSDNRSSESRSSESRSSESRSSDNRSSSSDHRSFGDSGRRGR